MLSIETSSGRITLVFKEPSSIIPKYRVPLEKCTKIDVSSRIKGYFSTKHSCFCGLLVEENECYRLIPVLKE